MTKHDNQPPFTQDEIERRSTLLLRTLPILLVPFVVFPIVIGILLRARPPLGVPIPAGGPPPPLIPIVVIIIFSTALIVLVRLGRPTVSALLLIGAWTGIATLVLLRGGVRENFTALLVIPICVAGLLIDGVACVSLAALATLLVWSAAWLEEGGFGPGFTLASGSLLSPYAAAAYWTVLFWIVAAITWMLAGGLQRALTQSRAQAKQLSELSAHLEQRVAEQTIELEQRANRAEALYAISRALTSTLDLQSVLRVIGGQATQLLHFDAAQVLLADPETGEFFVEGGSKGALGSFSLAHHQAELGEVLATGQARVVQFAKTEHGPPAAAMVLPMRYGTSVHGALALIDQHGAAERPNDDVHLAAGFAHQAAVAIANAQLLEQSRETATLAERTRLARDIHDTLAQGLTGIVVQLGAVQRALEHAPEQAFTHIELAQRMARESLAEARRSVWNLRAPALERGDLADALRGLVSQPLNGELTITIAIHGAPRPLLPDAESALLRVAQEALVNTTKHAHASQVHVALSYGAEAVQLEIADNGVGFASPAQLEHATVSGLWGGFGLLGMRERLAALGGRLELWNDGGAHVRASIAFQHTDENMPSPGSVSNLAEAERTQP